MTILDWVSPLRPDGTDIAEYTLRVGEALASRYELNLVANGDAGDLKRFVFTGAPFFNLGNDVRYHGAILDACRVTSGIVIAHDFRLQDLIVARLQQAHSDWEDQYSSLMGRHYGREGAAAAQDFLSGKLMLGELSAEYPGIEIAAENALCLVTHNPGLADDLARRTGLYCYALPLPFPVQPEVPLRKKASPDALDLLVFGYLGHNRGLEVVCDLLREHDKLRLHVAGRIGSDKLQIKLDQLKTAGRAVIDHGFVGEEELNQLVRDCDLVVNLRNPSMGEVSGSQLRIFAQQGLSVVCDTDWYASLPDEAVLKVSPGSMHRDLLEIVNQLLSDPDAFQPMRGEGRRYVERTHSLECFAAAFTDFTSASSEALAHGRRLLLAKHIAGLYERSGAGGAMTSQAILRKATHLL